MHMWKSEDNSTVPSIRKGPSSCPLTSHTQWQVCHGRSRKNVVEAKPGLQNETMIQRKDKTEGEGKSAACAHAASKGYVRACPGEACTNLSFDS